MQNQQIAEFFSQIADILDIQGGNPFRIRSYRATAQILADLPVSVASLVRTGGDIQQIRGIGKGTNEKVHEILETGACKTLEDLKKKIPSGLPELLRLQGLGPKRAKALHEELGVDSLDRLEKAARAGKLRSVAGMGAKTEEKLLRSIELYRSGLGRFKLSVGFTYAEALTAYLSAAPGVKEVEPAGSLRRRRETIGDLDILIICKKSGPVMEHFVNYPDVGEVLAKGDTKSSVRLQCGLQVDLRALEEESFGAALHYFTGSKEHNIAIRDRARDAGLKVNEYGVFKGKAEKRIGGAEENDIFKAVGLPFIPPELREARGEVEAAEAGKLPDLVELEDIRGDLQMHTTASDGRDTIAAMAKRAKQLGYEYIAITDHSKAVRIAGGLDDDELAEHLKQIDKANKRVSGIRILKSIEVDVLSDGSLDLSDEVLEQCDLVLASLHSGFGMPKKEMTKRVVRAIKHPLVNMLAHPTGRLVLERDPFQIDLEEVIKAAADNGVALEINAYPDRLDLKDTDARLAKEMGAKLVISTDAHSTDQLELMRYGVFTARRAWLGKTDVINTYPLKEMLEMLGR